MDSSEQQLLPRLQAGDRAACAELVRRYHGLLLGVARSMLRDGDAEDACQDAWIAAMKAIGSFEGRSSLRTWLTRIVINEAKMRLRRQGRELSLDAMSEEAHPLEARFLGDGHWGSPPHAWSFSGPEELLSEADLRNCLDHTLTALPTNQRVVLEMRDMHGMELAEICNSLGLSASNVRVLLHRARARVFQMVDHYAETGLC